MKNKIQIIIQQFIWAIVLVGYWVSLRTFNYNNNFCPRMFLFFDWQCLRLYPGIAYHIWLNLFVTIGIFIILLGPAVMVGFPNISRRSYWRKYFFWNLITIIIYCSSDMIGCIFFVPGQYHIPIFSIIVDCCVIALSIWSLHSINRQHQKPEEEPPQ